MASLVVPAGHIGNVNDNQTVYLKFTTIGTTGAPATLSGTPAISVYKDNNVTQTTTGVTLTVDFDGVTGLNHVTITTTDAFYATGSDFQVIITTGTVGGTSVVGYTVGSFSMLARVTNVIQWGSSSSAVAVESGFPKVTIAGTSAGPSGYMILHSIVNGIADSGTTTTLVDSDRTETATDYWVGNYIVIFDETGPDGTNSQCRLITGFTPASDTITFAPAVTTAVSSGFLYYILPASRVDVGQWLGTAVATPTTAGVPEVDITHWNGTAVASPHTAGYPVVTIKDGTGTGEIDTSSGKVLLQDGAVTAAVIATGAIVSGSFATSALNAIADAVLLRDWTAIVATVPARSALNALRAIRNKWSIVLGVLTVTKEDDATTAWTSAITTDANAEGITGSDPT